MTKIIKSKKKSCRPYTSSKKKGCEVYNGPMHEKCMLSKYNRCVIKKNLGTEKNEKKNLGTEKNEEKNLEKENEKKKDLIEKNNKKSLKENIDRSNTLIQEMKEILEKKLDKNWKKILYNKQEELLDIKKNINKIYINYDKDVNLDYPSYDNPLFNYLINKRKEFIDYKILKDDRDFMEKSLIECNSDFFKLTPNQIFLKNFISPSTPYKSLLIYHSMGVGKTQTAITIAEQFKQQIQKFKKKIYILTPGSLTNNFFNGIFDINKFDKKKYVESYKSLYLVKNKSKDLKNLENLNYVIPQSTGNTYIDGIINIDELSTMSNRKILAKVKKNIKKYYSIQGHLAFCNYVNNIIEKNTKGVEDNDEILYIRNKKIDELFSNSLIIVDEAHKISEAKMDDKLNKKGLSDGLGNLLLEIGKYSKNLRMILLSATPMVDTPGELITLLNILLQNDKRALLDETKLFKNLEKSLTLNKRSEELLRNSMRGYISFMRSETPGIFPFRINPDEKINFDSLPNIWFNKENKLSKIEEKFRLKYLNNLVTSYLGKFQYKVYKEKIIEKNNHHNFSIELAQISNIVYPDKNLSKKSFGEEGLNSVFKKNKRDSYSYKSEFTDNKFLKYENIGDYSCKFKSIFDKILNSEGIIFVYSQFVKAGVIPFALFLEQNGFRRHTFGKESQLLNPDDIDCEPLNYDCKKKSDCKKGEFFQAQYVLLTGEQMKRNPAEELQFLKKVNSIENNNGKNIKIILGSKVTGEGFDFKCIREVHILDPWHNLNQIEQTIGRGIRRCSHQSLDLKYRNVTIYLHAALNPLKEANGEKGEFKDIESVDLRMYRIGEIKERSIAKIKRICKEVAIDCNLSKINNIYLEKDWKDRSLEIITSQGKIIEKFDIFDKDNSFVSDFSICNYNCFDDINSNLIDKNKEIDLSTFQFYHSLEKIDELTEIIKSFFNENLYTDFNNIKKYIELNKIKFSDILLIKALDDIVKNNTLIRHKNNIGFIKYIGSYYIFNKDQEFIPIHYRSNNFTEKERSIDINEFLSKNIKNIEIKKYNKILTIDQIIKNIPDKKKIKKETYLSDSYFIECCKYIDRLDYNSYKNLIQFLLTDKKFIKTEEGIILDKIFEKHYIENKKKFFMIDNSQKKSVKNYYVFDKENSIFKLYLTEDVELSDFQHPPSKLIGFLDNSKNKFSFKYADLKIDRVGGAVCDQNSIPGAIDNFIERSDLNAFNKINSEKSEKKISKAKKCNILENILRNKEFIKKNNNRWFFRYYLDVIPPFERK